MGRSGILAIVSALALSGCAGGAATMSPGVPAQAGQAAAIRAFGTTESAGRNVSGTYKIVYDFAGGYNDGASPEAGLIDLGGTLYGTTAAGGASQNCPNGCGAIFKVTTSGKEHVLYSFAGPPSDGDFPVAALLDVGGSLWSTTNAGGSCALSGSGCGTVFNVTTSGHEAFSYSFLGSPDGYSPEAGLVEVAGKLYGTTALGGASSKCTSGCGTVFEITTGGHESVRYSFSGPPTDGSQPDSGLINMGGTLYGTTVYGGTSNTCAGGCGTVFKITSSGQESVLYSFGSQAGDGFYPGGLTNVGGTLYGVTATGGSRNFGTVFAVTTSGEERVLHDFGVGSDGLFPNAGLIDVGGTLYGTTERGGTRGHGTVFKIATSGNETVLYSFGSQSRHDGRMPLAGLVDVAGTLYGTTYNGGTNNKGTVFSIKP
jgi:uncharacterized repeat protein (TIGR03803 family)